MLLCSLSHVFTSSALEGFIIFVSAYVWMCLSNSLKSRQMSPKKTLTVFVSYVLSDESADIQFHFYTFRLCENKRLLQSMKDAWKIRCVAWVCVKYFNMAFDCIVFRSTSIQMKSGQYGIRPVMESSAGIHNENVVLIEWTGFFYMRVRSRFDLHES